ncbi:thioredoxin family protein [Nisaea nitritireducens]|uniref:thioredoxin family protein n=1 Tax=Nisaea nitritireducens TaxID=568392 RepID=UPI001866FA68|nr:thioredoxin family protein [Nisaea nitritireducens]
MALHTTGICNFGWTAPDFRLKGIDGAEHSLADLRGPNGTLVMFICNHCPYVKAIAGKIARDTAKLAPLGIASVAIMSNDTDAYPADSFDNMIRFAATHKFTFPYLIDETQQVARAYDAVCTPDFFGFDSGLGLQYRGRMDESGASPVEGARRDLFEAMKLVAKTGHGPQDQIASMGCSIKWKPDV